MNVIKLNICMQPCKHEQTGTEIERGLRGFSGFTQILNPFFCFGLIRVDPLKSDLIRVPLPLIYSCLVPASPA
jgi:hypothetical protein